jgi:surface antigen
MTHAPLVTCGQLHRLRLCAALSCESKARRHEQALQGGRQIGAYLEAQDRERMNTAAQQALPTGRVQTWSNPQSGVSGSAVASRAPAQSGEECRVVRQTVTLANATPQEESITACREPNGWEVRPARRARPKHLGLHGCATCPAAPGAAMGADSQLSGGIKRCLAPQVEPGIATAHTASATRCATRWGRSVICAGGLLLPETRLFVR